MRLALAADDPDMDWLGYLADSVIALVDEHLDGEQAFTGTLPIPPPVTTACILALTDSYRRKDLTFGIVGAWSPDGVALRVSRDWLDGVKASLQPYRVRFGVG
jgi:hypothetical protein